MEDFIGTQRAAVRVYESGSAVGTVSFLLSDHLGSLSVVVDANGNKLSELRYTAFGELRAGFGAAGVSDFTYTGQLSQMEGLGLMFYQARFYDPVTSHFTAADTIVPDSYNPMDWNRYLYARANPIMYNDPTGHDVGCPASNPACTKLSGYGHEDRARMYDEYIASHRRGFQETAKQTGAIFVTPQTGSNLFPGTPDPHASVAKYDNTCRPQNYKNEQFTTSRPVEEEPTDHLTGIFWGWSGSLSGPGLYTTGGMEEIVIPGGDNRATFNFLGYGSSAGNGGSGSVYFGALVNVDSPDEYQGLTSAAGTTVSALGYGITAGYFWNGLGTPFDIGSPKGYFLGYAPGAQLSIWQSSVLYTETWRYRNE